MEPVTDLPVSRLYESCVRKAADHYRYYYLCMQFIHRGICHDIILNDMFHSLVISNKVGYILRKNNYLLSLYYLFMGILASSTLSVHLLSAMDKVIHRRQVGWFIQAPRIIICLSITCYTVQYRSRVFRDWLVQFVYGIYFCDDGLVFKHFPDTCSKLEIENWKYIWFKNNIYLSTFTLGFQYVPEHILQRNIQYSLKYDIALQSLISAGVLNIV